MAFAELTDKARIVVRLESAAIMFASRHAISAPAPARRCWSWLLLVALAGCGESPSAPAPAPGRVPAADASVDAPAQLGLCASCHGRDGIAVAANTPDLAGRPSAELLAAMQAYLDGSRDHAPMRAMLGPIRPVDREALAEWFAAQPPPPATPP